MVIRKLFTGNDFVKLLETLRPFLPISKYDRLINLLTEKPEIVSTKITDQIKLIILRWNSNISWAVEIDIPITNINKAFSDAGFK